MGRRIYLQNMPLKEARSILLQVVTSLDLVKTEIIKVENALGRITAKAIFATLSSPHYPSAAMDGYAVQSEKTIGASKTSPKRLLLGSEAIPIDTGHALPPGFDAVIMIEDIFEGEGYIEIQQAAFPWQHLRSIGEDIVATQLLLPIGHLIRPVDIGALLSGGIWEVEVYKPPRVAVIPTGTELVKPGQIPTRGKIIESNSYMVSGMVKLWGGEPYRLSAVPDDYNLIKKLLLEEVASKEIVLISAGSSAGSKDYTASIIEEEGELLVHGTAIRPGKPAVLGVVRGVPVIGLPGFPVAAAIVMEQFVKPALDILTGKKEKPAATLSARISRQVVSTLKAEEFLRVKLGKVKDVRIAVPLPRGSGGLMSLVQADGLVRIPQLKEGLQAGEEVKVQLYDDSLDIDQTLVCSGSHDLSLDILAEIFQEEYPGSRFSSTHVGSLGGIMALKRKEAHLAGCHLLDESSGVYNLPFLKKLLPEEDLVVVKLVKREQGLIVPQGNPKNITGLQDLIRPDIQFVNRQKGAGTRILLDYTLKKMKISAEKISGYNKEEFNHLAVAAAVKGSSADCGLGLLAAARAFDLDFVSLAWEEYSLVILKEHFYSEPVQNLMKVIKSNEFKERVEKLGGYVVS